ncbi:hypothetical protein AGMMS49944_26580 [Spirochaetia bacterium]|nr:hypothetical protein AGMMS49944_26580 [Spirochaetia bacterium]
MTLYHGSNQLFDTVDLSKSKDRRDFGRGFYMTTIREQAVRWAQTIFDRYGGSGRYLYVFKFLISDSLRYKIFEDMDLEWLEMVQLNRIKGGTQHNYDIIKGPVANDRTTRTISLYIEGVYTAEVALQQLKLFKANDQVSIHTPRALSGLSLKECLSL